MINRTPKNERIVIDPIKEDTVKKVNNIYAVNTTEKRGVTKRGVVVNFDPSLDLKVGDVIYHRNGVGIDVELDGKEYLIIKATDIEIHEREN